MRDGVDNQLESVQKIVAERGPEAYVVTVSEGPRPHAVFVPVSWSGQGLVAQVGTQTARNAGARPEVTILYPPRRPGDYSFVVDGTAVVSPGHDGNQLTVTPTRAVFHRPGPAADPSRPTCTADCVPVLEPTA